MPPVLNATDIYSADHASSLSPVVRNFPYRIYVPNTGAPAWMSSIPKTYKSYAFR